MKCPKCNSENVQFQAKEVKPQFTTPLCLMFGGIGLIFLSIIGAIIGVVLGLIVGAILSSALPSGQQSIMVCQECGYVMQPKDQPITPPNQTVSSNPLFCNPEESNLDVIRDDVDKGTIVVIQVKVDEYAPFNIFDNTTTTLKVPDGVHTISYEQINGIGKKKNKGQLSIVVNEKKNITFSFTRQGVIVK